MDFVFYVAIGLGALAGTLILTLVGMVLGCIVWYCQRKGKPDHHNKYVRLSTTDSGRTYDNLGGGGGGGGTGWGVGRNLQGIWISLLMHV